MPTIPMPVKTISAISGDCWLVENEARETAVGVVLLLYPTVSGPPVLGMPGSLGEFSPDSDQSQALLLVVPLGSREMLLPNGCELLGLPQLVSQVNPAGMVELGAKYST